MLQIKNRPQLILTRLIPLHVFKKNQKEFLHRGWTWDGIEHIDRSVEATLYFVILTRLWNIETNQPIELIKPTDKEA